MLTNTQIFTHLTFYIDSAEHAKKNDLDPSDPPREAVERYVPLSSGNKEYRSPFVRLRKAEKLLKDNGGRLTTSISDPKLTHIIMDDEDSDRYAELTRKTSKPKRKHIVLPSWVDECLEEETLMNEDGKFW